jgi:hypothetical protein
VLDGGPGPDTVDYHRRFRPVSVNFASGSTAGERGEGDVLTSIESAIGGAGRDRLVGNGQANRLEGRADDDVLIANGGRDDLRGGRGRDRLSAGGGADRLAGNSGRDRFECGHGMDTVFTLVPGELVGPHCNFGDFTSAFGRLSDYELALPLRPRSVTRRGVLLHMKCPDVRELEDAEFSPCTVRVTLRTRHGRLLGRKRFQQSDESDPDRVRIRFTALGRRLVRRRHGVVASVSVSGLATNPDRGSARIGWAIRLKR